MLVKPVRRGVLLFVLLLVIEYLVVPELVGASKDLYLLGRVNAVWLAAGVLLEVLSLFCYALLTRVLLPRGRQPSLSRLFRIDLSAAAVAHVIPAGTLGTAALGYRLFTAEGISGNDAAVMMADQGSGLNRRAERAAVAVLGRLHSRWRDSSPSTARSPSSAPSSCSGWEP